MHFLPNARHPSLESLLCENHGRKYCCLVGNGTTALTIALMSLGIRGGNVAIPTAVCPNVVMAAYFSGNKPIYLDIDPVNLGLSYEALCDCKEKIDAVVAVHAYGSICDIERLQRYCDDSDIPLVEDAAVAMGAVSGDRPVGSFGKVSILSFGAGKIISVNHGGAILTDDIDLYQKICIVENGLSSSDSNDEHLIDQFGRYHTKLYNEHYGKDHWKFSDEFKKKALSLRPNYLSRFDIAYADLIVNELTFLGNNLSSRREKACILADLFSKNNPNGIKLNAPTAGSAHWRFNVFISEGRNRVLKSLLRKGYRISSWFPPADQFFEGRRNAHSSSGVADCIGEQILNIWVNHEVDIDYLRKIHEELLREPN